MSRASQAAYRKIRSFILRGDAIPGMQLSEKKLTEISGVSRTSVRDAVKRLENEMLIVRSASKRISVVDWRDWDIEEIFTLRAMLEAHAAQRAATRIDGESLKALRSINEELKQAIASFPLDIPSFLPIFLDSNRRFHDLILECAESPRLSLILPTLLEPPIIARTAHHYSIAQLEQSASDHDELLATFSVGDSQWAHSVMTGHILRAFHVFSAATSRVEGNAKHEAHKHEAHKREAQPSARLK